MVKLRINPFVAVDLKNIRDYIAEDNPQMALETVEQLYEQIEMIQHFPNLGTDLSKRVSFKTDYKYVVSGNYILLYKVCPGCVEIYRIINRFQDFTSIFD